MSADNFSKEYVVDKLLRMGYMKTKHLEKSDVYERTRLGKLEMVRKPKKWRITFADGTHAVVDARHSKEAVDEGKKLSKLTIQKVDPLEKSFLQDARQIINSQKGATAQEKHEGLNMVLDVIRSEEEYDGENKTDDSKDSKDFHKDLFDVEDELMDFIRNESEGKQKEDKLEKPSKQFKKSGGRCPFDGRQGVYLRRFFQAPYWIREYKCPKGHIFQETQ
jgi:hypothetical protein